MFYSPDPHKLYEAYYSKLHALLGHHGISVSLGYLSEYWLFLYLYFPNATPNASWWNIVCVGYPRLPVGHVDFMVCVSISFTLGSQRECAWFLVEYALKDTSK